MAKDAVATMGGLLPDDAGGRDAVHVAVFSATAEKKIWPGMDVVIVEQGEPDVKVAQTVIDDKPVGIVDPFLQGAVMPGQRFWVYLYPRTITALSHRWSHPALPDAKPGEIYAPPSQKLASQQYIDEIASNYGFTGERMIRAAQAWVDHEEYWCDGGTFEGEHLPEEFWTHFERVTGTSVDHDKKQSFFTCSC